MAPCKTPIGRLAFPGSTNLRKRGGREKPAVASLFLLRRCRDRGSVASPRAESGKLERLRTGATHPRGDSGVSDRCGRRPFAPAAPAYRRDTLSPAPGIPQRRVRCPAGFPTGGRTRATETRAVFLRRNF